MKKEKDKQSITLASLSPLTDEHIMKRYVVLTLSRALGARRIVAVQRNHAGIVVGLAYLPQLNPWKDARASIPSYSRGRGDITIEKAPRTDPSKNKNGTKTAKITSGHMGRGHPRKLPTKKSKTPSIIKSK